MMNLKRCLRSGICRDLTGNKIKKGGRALENIFEAKYIKGQAEERGIYR